MVNKVLKINSAQKLCLEQEMYTVIGAKQPGLEVMLNSIEHEIYPAHKC